jgi:hypothetical protein
MMLVLEIGAVIGGYLILVMTAVTLVRNAKRLGRTAKIVQSHTHPQVMVLMTQSDTAQQRVFSITGHADRLQRQVEKLMNSAARLLVIINAFREVSGRISRAMRKLGF